MKYVPTLAITSLKYAALCASVVICSQNVQASPATEPSNSQIQVRPPESAPETAREFYNAGTRRLNEGKWREAEAFLQSALAFQEEPVQPSSLFNLGHVRFMQGVEELKKGPSAAEANARARSALQTGQQALEKADEALAGTDVQQLVDSYLSGRGARRSLREATKVVRRALQAYGATLTKWERASSDFKSAAELDPSDKASKDNAEAVDKAIAQLVDSIREMQQAAAAMEQKKDELGQKMKELKGRIPEEDMPPGAPGDDEEEEEQPQGQRPEEKEQPQSSQGDDTKIPPELANWILDSFKLDKDRKLPMGQQDVQDFKRPPGKTW